MNIDKNIPNRLIGDDQRLSQIITNLLSNAVKFTPEEGTIRLDSRLISKKDGYCPNGNEYCRIQISIEDTGIGIDDAEKERLFRCFEQAEAGTSRKYGGTGLGLAISKRIVELMGGDIWVESEPGKGSKFIFTVLLKCGADEKKRRLDESVNWKNVRIFVVDDEPEIREFFTVVSDKLNISCTVAASGTEAAEMLYKDSDYNIYFIDWRLPDMTGGEVARRIHEKTAHNPIVIIFSAADRNVIENEAHAAGADKFLPKPLFPSVIHDIVSEFIGASVETEPGQADYKEYADDFTGYTILLAEDMEINSEIVMSLLEPAHLKIDRAMNGAQAVGMFAAAAGRYDMILMDIQMPEMDGYEATRKIRTSDTPGAETVPIIAMTADVFREDIEKCLEAGMNGHIGKPINLDEIYKQLRRYLRKRNSTDS